MTRKEELEARATSYVNLFATSGTEGAAKAHLMVLLTQVEWEVWEKVCAEMQSRHLSSASSGPDDRAASAAIEVYKCMEVLCREQQKGVEG